MVKVAMDHHVHSMVLRDVGVRVRALANSVSNPCAHPVAIAVMMNAQAEEQALFHGPRVFQLL